MAFNDNLEFSSCAVGVDLTVSQCYKCLSVTSVSVLQVSQCYKCLSVTSVSVLQVSQCYRCLSVRTCV